MKTIDVFAAARMNVPGEPAKGTFRALLVAEAAMGYQCPAMSDAIHTEKLRVLHLEYGGEFLCMGPGGEPLRVRGVAPGEEASAKSTSKGKGLLHQILAPSPERAQPLCPLFGKCGGCDLQHMEIGAQRREKLEMVKRMLSASGIDAGSIALAGADTLPSYYYRKRITLHLTADGTLGFCGLNSTGILEVEVCPLAMQPINEALSRWGPLFKKCAGKVGRVTLESHADQLLVALELIDELRPDEAFIPDDLREELARGIPNLTIEYHSKLLLRQFGGKPLPRGALHFPVGHFSQVNDAGNQVLHELTLDFLRGCDSVTDLYAGAGNFSLPLARRGARVDLVEADSSLIEFAQDLAHQEELSARLRHYTMSCERFVRRHELREVVLLDPPRSGAPEVIESIAQQQPRRVVYISCGLPTFCRDGARLSTAGYRLSDLRIVDMFAQSSHVELVGLFERAG